MQGIPAHPPPAHSQLLPEADTHARRMEADRAYQGSSWAGTATESLRSWAEVHQPDWDLDPQHGHLGTESRFCSADGAEEEHGTSVHGLFLQEKNKQREREQGWVLLGTGHSHWARVGLLP